jgi:hypothetical protein
VLLLSHSGLAPALAGRRRGGIGVSEHAPQIRHLRFNLAQVLLVTHQRRF